MSLKMFHLIFISAAIVLCAGFGIWCLEQGNRAGLGIGSLIVAVALIVYEAIFFKKFTLK